MLFTPKQTPEQALELVFDELKKAPSHKNHPLRLFTFCTIDSEQSAPQNRMVVLRHFNEDHTFEFYTDFRSSKILQLQTNPKISALFWDPDKQVQIRLTGRGEIHHQTERSKRRWRNVSDTAKKDYGTILPPGFPISSSEEALEWGHETASRNFTVIRGVSQKIDILQIGRNTHLSLHFTLSQKDQNWVGEWQVP